MDTTQNLTPTPASAWKGKIDIDGTDMLLPSGNVARVKQIDPMTFVTGGMLPDPLSAIVTKAINERKGVNPAQMQKIAEDPKMLASTLELFDRVLADVVIMPQVEMPPACGVMVDGDEPCGLYANQPVHETPAKRGHHRYQEGPRDPNVLYADQVDMQDKMFIFNAAMGGVKDLEKFRDGLEATVESVSDGQDVQRPAKRPASRR